MPENRTSRTPTTTAQEAKTTRASKDTKATKKVDTPKDTKDTRTSAWGRAIKWWSDKITRPTRSAWTATRNATRRCWGGLKSTWKSCTSAASKFGSWVTSPLKSGKRREGKTGATCPTETKKTYSNPPTKPPPTEAPAKNRKTREKTPKDTAPKTDATRSKDEATRGRSRPKTTKASAA